MSLTFEEPEFRILLNNKIYRINSSLIKKYLKNKHSYEIDINGKGFNQETVRDMLYLIHLVEFTLDDMPKFFAHIKADINDMIKICKYFDFAQGIEFLGKLQGELRIIKAIENY